MNVLMFDFFVLMFCVMFNVSVVSAATDVTTSINSIIVNWHQHFIPRLLKWGMTEPLA